MRKLAIMVVLAMSLGMMAAGSAMAAPEKPKANLNWGSQLNAAQCDTGRLVINVSMKVTNDADSGQAGNYWAADDYTKNIQVWETSPGSYCAVVKYLGTFTTVEGRSPGNTTTIQAGIKGASEGGSRYTITGTLKSNPGFPTTGVMGEFDFKWNPSDQSGAVPGYISWIESYFDAGYSYTQDWWGWIYRANGSSWVNAGAGNSGDITG